MTPLEYLSQEKFQSFKPGFDRVERLLEALGHPERKLRFFHVAGTNGKGSTCACVSSILTKAGYRTGLYISPFVVCWNERVQIDGQYISDEEFAQAVAAVGAAAEAMDDLPSQFELETALALWHFARRGCDLAVMEVGMGGAWDATNVIPAPEAAVLCAIALDHTAVLGNTVGEIAAVKAGIIKPGCDVVSYGNEPEAEKVMNQLLLTAAALKAPVIRLWAGTKAPENTTAAERKQIEYELNRLVDQADKKGVRLATEYHRGTLTQNAESAAALMEAVPGLYTYWQPNPDVSEQTNRDELARMLPWLLNVHVFQWTAPGNQRHPLAEGTAIWTEYIRKASAEKSRDHHFLLEFVKDDSREQCLADASVLNRIVKESEKYL